MEGVLAILVISVVALNHVGKSENVCGRMNTTISMFYEYQNAQAAVTWRRQDLSILSVVSNPGCSSTLNNSRYIFLCEDGNKRFVLQVNNPVDGELYYIGTIDDNRTVVIQDKGSLSLSDDSSACKLDTEVQLVCTIGCSKPKPRLTWKLRNTSGTLQNLPGGVESIITGCQSGYFSKNSTITISNTTTALDGLDNYTIICEASFPDCNIPTTTDRVNSSCSKVTPVPVTCPLECILIVIICGVLAITGCIVCLWYRCCWCRSKKKNIPPSRISVIAIFMVVIAVIVIIGAVVVFIICKCCIPTIIVAALELIWSIVCLCCCCCWYYFRKEKVPWRPLEIVKSDATSVTIRWKPPKDDCCCCCLPVKSYIIERRNVNEEDWIKVKAVGAEILTCVVDKLIVGKSYMFRVFAANCIFLSKPLVSDGAVKIRSKPEVPAPPSNFRCSKKMPDSVTLEWGTPFDNGGLPLTGYAIEAKDSKLKDWSPVANINAGVNCHVVRNLEQEKEYNFRISATNEVGRSQPVTMDTPVIVKPMGTNGILLSNLPSGNNTNANNSGAQR